MISTHSKFRSVSIYVDFVETFISLEGLVLGDQCSMMEKKVTSQLLLFRFKHVDMLAA